MCDKSILSKCLDTYHTDIIIIIKSEHDMNKLFTINTLDGDFHIIQASDHYKYTEIPSCLKENDLLAVMYLHGVYNLTETPREVLKIRLESNGLRCLDEDGMIFCMR